MSGEVEALLHLAALGTALTAGYIGLDRLRSGEDKLGEEIKTVRAAVNELIIKYDFKQTDRERLKMIFDNYLVYVLCHVADEPLRLGLHRPLHALHRQWYVPLLGYYRKRADLAVVGALFGFDVGIFFLITFALLWKQEDLISPFLLKVYFVVISSGMVWMFLSTALSYRIRRIGSVCQRLEGNVLARARAAIDDAFNSFPGGRPAVTE